MEHTDRPMSPERAANLARLNQDPEDLEMSATERAAELGAEHGRRDAEAWLAPYHDNRCDAFPLPLPNVADQCSLGGALRAIFQEADPEVLWGDLSDSYCDAYRSARDERLGEEVAK